MCGNDVAKLPNWKKIAQRDSNQTLHVQYYGFIEALLRLDYWMAASDL